jgi:ABC-type glycerol-3-phosphate transport system substrate-binding protein
MNRFRRFHLLAAVSAACVLVSACSGPKSEKTDKLVVWSTESDKNAGKVLEKLETEFERRHPGVDLVIETIAWNDLSERLINASQSGAWPDVSHIQPFMAYSLYDKKQLLPITDVRDAVEKQNGPIFPAVRDLQVYGKDKQVYGLAYAVGTTFWSILGERLPPNESLSEVKTWDDYVRLAKLARAADPNRNRVTLPGAAPFFMDQLFGELVANAGGRLFNEKGCPTLTSKPVIESLQFFRQLKDAELLANDWPTQAYADQFDRLAKGSVFSVPVTYARAAQTVRGVYEKEGRSPKDASDKTLLWLDQPTSKAGLGSIATIDAEPWVVFQASANRRQADGKGNDQLAKEFIRMFYAPEFYAEYTKQVPIHLTPIFERMASEPDYVAATRPFEAWHQRTLERLRDGSTRPILMPDLSPSGRSLPFLLEFQRANILSGAITDVLQTDNSIQAAAERAQLRAMQLVKRSGLKCSA